MNLLYYSSTPPNATAIARTLSWCAVFAIFILCAGIVLRSTFVPLHTQPGQRMAADLDIKGLKAGLEAFRIDVGRYPTVDEGLIALVDPASRPVGWRGPYIIRQRMIDPWGKPYVYDAGPAGGEARLNQCDLQKYRDAPP